MREQSDTSWAIRTATAADLPELKRVYRAASLSNEGDAPLLLARPEFLDYVGDDLARGRTRAAVRDDGRVLGFATLARDAQGGPELEDLFVDPDRRREGIARALVADLIRTGCDPDDRYLSVTGNPHALDFYRAVGFLETGRISTALGTGLRMRLDLTTAPSRR
ncbi:GNAT family N-acetyltransferase [Cryptosporangium sp. NPDC051539]|uniref:GNAT family N-acetyltransferase n=1 Tax=Cryptosporangium sp. NPDC051539 TaxID=3363962 RepID=UPI00379896A0